MESNNTQEKLEVEFDASFLREKEGEKKTGYIPPNNNNNANSGVTIAAELDLGHQDEKSLTEMGVSESLKSRFRPFLGRLYKDNPDLPEEAKKLQITDQELEELVKKSFEKYYQDLKIRFKPKLRQLSYGALTALLSIYYHFGNFNGWRKKVEKVVNSDLSMQDKNNRLIRILKGEDVEQEFLNCFLEFKTRRASEAKFIEEHPNFNP